jgi:hypothetical protein
MGGGCGHYCDLCALLACEIPVDMDNQRRFRGVHGLTGMEILWRELDSSGLAFGHMGSLLVYFWVELSGRL